MDRTGFVLTHRPPRTWADPGISFLSESIEDAVATALAAAAGRNLEIFGADVARQCLAGDLLDEIVVHFAPVLLGEGVRFYDAPGAGPIELVRTALGESGQVTDLRFRVEPRSEAPAAGRS